VGSLPSVTAGEWLVAEGCWVRDREHGLQFKATTMKTVPPTTAEGIERYLGSGLVKGIGPILAKKLVGRFGAEVLAVIENRAAELQSVDGIGPKRRERIAHAWQEAKQVREIMLFLHSHGVSTSRAVRIFKTYGEQAIEKRYKAIPKFIRGKRGYRHARHSISPMVHCFLRRSIRGLLSDSRGLDKLRQPQWLPRLLLDDPSGSQSCLFQRSD
jgi:ATP-dependent exoDNAse (exonuclease V) alpha subunit